MISSFPHTNKWNCSKQDSYLCLHSYYALLTSLKNSYTNPYCAKYNGENDLVNEVCRARITNSRKCRPKPHFRLLISFDEDDKSHNENIQSTIQSLISKKKSVGGPLSFHIIEKTCIRNMDGNTIQTTTITRKVKVKK